MAIMRWDPFAEFDRMLGLVGRGSSGDGQTLGMAMDVYRSGDEYVVEMDLPGVDPSSINLKVERNTLTVEASAESKHEDVDEVLVCERRHVRYRRQLYLGDDVKTDNVQASYDNGVLRIRIPISKEQKAREIPVSTGTGAKQLSTDASSQSQPGETSKQQERERETAGQSSR
jgi:HSP20 family protein